MLETWARHVPVAALSWRSLYLNKTKKKEERKKEERRRKKKEERRRKKKKKKKKKKKINSVHGFASSWRLAARRPEPTRGNRLPALTRWFVGLHLNQVH